MLRLNLLDPLNDFLQGVPLTAVVVPIPSLCVVCSVAPPTRALQFVNSQIEVAVMYLVQCGSASRFTPADISHFEIDVDHEIHCYPLHMDRRSPFGLTTNRLHFRSQFSRQNRPRLLNVIRTCLPTTLWGKVSCRVQERWPAEGDCQADRNLGAFISEVYQTQNNINVI